MDQRQLLRSELGQFVSKGTNTFRTITTTALRAAAHKRDRETAERLSINGDDEEEELQTPDLQQRLRGDLNKESTTTRVSYSNQDLDVQAALMNDLIKPALRKTR